MFSQQGDGGKVLLTSHDAMLNNFYPTNQTLNMAGHFSPAPPHQTSSDEAATAPIYSQQMQSPPSFMPAPGLAARHHASM